MTATPSTSRHARALAKTFVLTEALPPPVSDMPGERAARVREWNPGAHICFYGLYASLNAAHLLARDARGEFAGWKWVGLAPDRRLAANDKALFQAGRSDAFGTALVDAVQGGPLQPLSAVQLIADLSQVPEDIRTAVRNNGGGHVNHTMF